MCYILYKPLPQHFLPFPILTTLLTKAIQPLDDLLDLASHQYILEVEPTLFYERSNITPNVVLARCQGLRGAIHSMSVFKLGIR